ncbi:MAG TPA: hypothetical protein VN258_18810 [Mobilitalea sp.]|nr:hypothetical protein [Mobilitalea sp.]
MKKFRIIILNVFLFIACFSLVACNQKAASTDKTAPDDKATANVLAAPSDFTLDTETGDFSFTANDANAGYYFVRAFAVVNGVETSTYTTSSKRINGGKTGSITGKIDTSKFGWGSYDVKLVTFAAAGSGYTAPDSVVLSTSFGVGGTLEKPEIMALADGSEVEFVIDWYTLSDWYTYQFLPSNVTFNIYSDAACTTLVDTKTVDTSTLTINYHPTGGIMWGEDAAGEHKWINNQYASKFDSYKYTLDPGTYYVTCQAVSSDATINSSKVSDVVEFTLTSDAPTGTYTAAKSALWQDPQVMGVPLATSGMYTDRVDFGQTQTTSSKVN